MHAIVLALCAGVVAGHGALFMPRPRNSEDMNLPQFAGGKSPQTPCTCANGYGGKDAPEHGCNRGLRGNAGGQSCLWWSQGCSIGCEKCASPDSPHAPSGLPPHTDKLGFRTRYCNSTFQATLPREAWTMNVNALAGSEEDSYRFNPWRAPGHAPVVDACGQAGGRFPQCHIGGDSVFTNTSMASMGDLGSKVLRPSRNKTKWIAGSSVEVAWGIRYNHGGGYQYRLCPASSPLTEECFQKMPLDFDRTKQALLWNNGTRYPIKGIFVDKGVKPEGSTWARNPIPRINDDNIGLHNPGSCPGPDGRSGPGCMQFPAPCPQDTGPYPWSTDGSGQGACSGDWTAGLISDHVLIPKDLPAGDYVLGWRQDCEETAQIWSNCADIHIENPNQDVVV
mmetsp:Transcript_39930/g.71823  ORF Transcript_39930/g.71823 Transcript_39930/m.71823 type:complete len:393 (-) Transcript_39930:125-1303(-)